jgi:hypothetical protein
VVLVEVGLVDPTLEMEHLDKVMLEVLVKQQGPLEDIRVAAVVVRVLLVAMHLTDKVVLVVMEQHQQLLALP